MISPDRLLRSILEADDDETIKDILGGDYLEEPKATPLQGRVDRHDRWADIQIGETNFCVSYLTPVAMFTSGIGITLTERRWSGSTLRHIIKWTNQLGIGPMGGYRRYADIENGPHTKMMPQEELISIFKEEAKKVRWSKRQVRKASSLPSAIPFLKGGGDERVHLNVPYD